MMKKLIIILIAGFTLVQCGRDQSSLIERNQLGSINKNTTIEELDKLFKNDSIEKYPADTDLILEFRVFDLDGKPKLVVMPKLERDSVKGMELIKIYSADYVTEKGISTISKFKDVADNYSINKIEPSFSAANLFVDELNAIISLNKKDLNLDEFDMREIRQEQIPDEANINYITLWLE